MKVTNTGPFFIILGAPRSGTYLLTTQLQLHASLAIPVETQFVPIFSRFLSMFGDLSLRSNREILVGCIYDFLKIWTFVGMRQERPREQVQFSLLSTEHEQSRIIDNTSCYADIVDSLFSVYSTSVNADGRGDKSAYYYPVDLDALDASVSNMKVIHIVRDCRAVAASWCKEWFGPGNIEDAAHLWVNHINTAMQWAERNEDRYIRVRYEDLLDSPEYVIKKLVAFMALSEPDPATLAHAEKMREIVASANYHQLLGSDIDPSNKEKWKFILSMEELKSIENIAGTELNRLGYTVGDISRTSNNTTEHGFIALRKFIRGASISRKARDYLPPVLYAFRRAGFPLPGILRLVKII